MPHEREKEEKTCDIKGCNNAAVRSLSTRKVIESGALRIDHDDQKKHRAARGRTHVCKECYREFKKATRKKREIDRLGR